MKYFPLIFAALLFVACENDSYDKGTGESSLTTADLLLAHANSNKAIDYIVIDDNTKLTIDEPVTAKWVLLPTPPIVPWHIIIRWGMARRKS